MAIKSLIKLNIYVFLFYFLAYFAASKIDLGIFHYAKIILGLAIFFIVGLNIAKLAERIFRLTFDFWELLTIGTIIALFFMPVVVFVFYKISGFISETSIILMYLSVSAAALLSDKIIEKKNEFGKN